VRARKGACAGRPRIVKTKKGRRIVKRSTSRHQDGIALDARAGTGTDDEFVCLHEFAQFNPQFGVRFPLGKHDRPHMEPAASNHRPLRIAAIGVVRRHVTPCAKLKNHAGRVAGGLAIRRRFASQFQQGKPGRAQLRIVRSLGKALAQAMCIAAP